MRFLLHEHRFPLIEAETGEVSIVRPVKKLPSLVWPHSAEKIPLVIAIKMNLECLARSFVAIQELFFYIGLPGCGNQSSRPILSRENIVDLSPRRYSSRP